MLTKFFRQKFITFVVFWCALWSFSSINESLCLERDGPKVILQPYYRTCLPNFSVSSRSLRLYKLFIVDIGNLWTKSACLSLSRSASCTSWELSLLHVEQLLQAHRHWTSQRSHPGRKRRRPGGRVWGLREEDCRGWRHRVVCRRSNKCILIAELHKRII